MNDDLLEELKNELQSEDELIRQTALTCLLRLGSGENIYAIIRRISEEDESPKLRYLAKKGLNSLNIKARPEFEYARDLIRKLLENIGPKRLEVYKRVLRGNDSFLKLEMLNLLITDHKAIANSHNEINYALVELLKEQLSSEQDLYLAAQYVKALGYFGSNKDINFLQRLLQNKNPRIVANSIEALQNIDEITAVNMVMPLLKHKDNRVRGNAILLVYSQDPTKALSELANMAASKKLWMRSSALYCIKTLNFDEKEQYLAQMLYDESDDSIINEILDWMKFNGSKISAVALSQKIESSSNDLKLSLKVVLDLCLEKCKLTPIQLEKAVLNSNKLRQYNIAREIEDRAEKIIDTDESQNYSNFSEKIKSVLKLSCILTLGTLFVLPLFHLINTKKLVSPYGDSSQTVHGSPDFKSYVEANYIKSQGLYLEASHRFKILLKKYPYDSLLILDYSESLALMSKYEECLTVLSQSKSVIKKNPRYFRMLAQATLNTTQNRKKVEQIYLKAINHYPDNSRLLMDALFFYEMIKDEDKASEVRSALDSIIYK